MILRFPVLAFLTWSAGAAPAPFDSVMRHLARPNGFRAADFNLMINYPDNPPRTLSAVEGLLRRPASADSLIPALRASLTGAAQNAFANSGSWWTWLDLPSPAPAGPDSLGPLLRRVDRKVKDFLQPLASGEIAFLRAEMPPLFRRRQEDTSLNPIQAETLRLREEAVADETMRLAAKMPMESLAGAAQDLDAVLVLLIAEARADWRGAAKKIRALQRLGIPVRIGGEGSDVHRLNRGVVFDPGGDDRYEFPDSARPGTWLLVLDLGGDDEYRAKDTVGGAAGFLSLSVLADLGGDDGYAGKDLAFASALLGYARLFDAAGNDRYEARCASLGFAFQGLGILEDLEGNDVYSAAFLSEGASSTRGLGLLADGGGNDQYLARPEFVDDLRYRDHFLSLSQGFSTGFSPRHAGGIAVLWDRSGEDLYSADIFGQGSGYWFALGLLMDDAGSDKFLAHQYAQGAGVHFAAGVLWDMDGNDFRASKGVSQGCGHDAGFGLLVDERGDDRNIGVDMSQGAGSANGLGVFCDLAGSDRHEPANPDMALGHGDMRRDRGSLGFFLDLGGKDFYPAGFGNGSVWRVYDGKKKGYGHGRDAE